MTEAGWKDLFPGGNLGDYVAAQNASFGRPLTAPITAGEPVTGRYQAIIGPWTHGENVNADPLQDFRLEWFDTWLKGMPTGMANTAAPLHLFENGASRWVDSAAWPPAPSVATYYLGGGGSLAAAQPAGTGSDTLYYDQPSSSVTYTSAPLAQATALDGPTDVTVYLRSTTADAQVVATLNTVAPDGTVTKQGDGVLLASQRQLDPRNSWYGAGNALLQPSHPFTQASQQFLTAGQTVRLDIAVLPNFTQIPAGDRIQLVLSSQAPANFHLPLAPTPLDKANLAASTDTIYRSAPFASFINLPLTNPYAFVTSPTNWGPSS